MSASVLALPRWRPVEVEQVSRFLRKVALVVVLAVVASYGVSAVTSSSTARTTSAASALREVVPDVVAASAAVAEATNLPKTLRDGVTVATGVSLVSTAATDTVGKDVLPGIREYGKVATHTYVAMQQLTDGSVRTLSVLTGASAPTQQTYRVDMPAGASLRELPEGGVAVVNAAEYVVAVIAAPWARDASGRSVPTHYEVSGNLLTQVTNHAGFNYPVVVDPVILGVVVSWWMLMRIAACVGSGFWAWFYSGASRWQTRLWYSALSCMAALGVRR